MQPKFDADSTTAGKVLRLYQRLLLDGRRHFQKDLAAYLNCSIQTVMRLIGEIEGVIGACLVTGLEKHRRWYQIKSVSRNRLGLDFEELRYLAICRDLADPYLPDNVKTRVDKSLFAFSMLMADPEYAGEEKIKKRHIGHCAKGWIDYTPYFGFLEKLVVAADEDRVCLISYKAATNKKTKVHKFAVARIVSMNSALYALGAILNDDFGGIRHFANLAVHRIRNVVLADRHWKLKLPEGDLSMFGLPWHEPRKFRIKFSGGVAAQYVRERVWSERQRMIPQPDGGLILELFSRSEPEIKAWARSFGDDAILLPPEKAG